MSDDVTRILHEIEQGDQEATERLLPLVYDELRKLAAAKLGVEKPGQTLQATALVHEAYMRLVKIDDSQEWNGRGHFFGAAAEAMRRILVESARRKQRIRHGGELQRVSFDVLDLADDVDSEQTIAIDEAIERLAAEFPEVAQVVKLRYFAGLTIPQTAAAMEISVRTANRHWAYAKAWLYDQLH